MQPRGSQPGGSIGIRSDRQGDEERIAGQQAIAILRALPDAVLTLDAGGVVRIANPAAEKLFGRSARDLVGLALSDLVAIESDTQPLTAPGHARTALSDARDGFGLRPDGGMFPLEVSMRTLHVGGRERVVVVCRDSSERRQLEYDVLHISDEERARISNDLHDGLGSLLTGASFALHAVGGTIRKGDIPDIAVIEKVTALVDEGANAARDIARGLSPLDLGAAALGDGIRRVVDHALSLSGTEIDVDVRPIDRLPDSRVATQLYRIAQEAIQNAVKHARASVVRVALDGSNEQITLSVVDDGVGLPTGRSVSDEGIGIRSMRYRARLVGASLTIAESPNGGTSVLCVYRFPTNAGDHARG